MQLHCLPFLLVPPENHPVGLFELEVPETDMDRASGRRRRREPGPAPRAAILPGQAPGDLRASSAVSADHTVPAIMAHAAPQLSGRLCAAGMTSAGCAFSAGCGFDSRRDRPLLTRSGS